MLSSSDSELFVNSDGTVTSRIKAAWDQSVDQNAGGSEVEYKFSSDPSWTPAANTINIEINFIYISPVNDGVNYDVRVRTINNIGVPSDWVEILNYTVIGKVAPPPDCDSFKVQRLSDGTREYSGGLLDSNRPVDFLGYVLRAGVGTGLTWSQLKPLHVGVITQLPFESNQLAENGYTIGIKAVDTTLNESVNAKLIFSDLGPPRIGNAFLTIDFHADGWPDIKTNSWWIQTLIT